MTKRQYFHSIILENLDSIHDTLAACHFADDSQLVRLDIQIKDLYRANDKLAIYLENLPIEGSWVKYA